jgi:hypothetical protein
MIKNSQKRRGMRRHASLFIFSFHPDLATRSELLTNNLQIYEKRFNKTMFPQGNM